MDTNVMSAFEVLAAAMRANRYKESTIEQMRKMFACLSKLTADGCYSEGAGKVFVESGWPDGRPHTVQHRRVKARIVELIEGYFLRGSFDLTAKPAAPPPQPQGAEFKSSLTGFAVAERERGIAESTLGKCVDYARILLIYAEGKGLTGISALDAPLLLEFMSHMRDVRPGTDPCYIAGPLRSYFRHLGRDDLVEALRMVPSWRKRPIFEVLSDEDEKAVASACCNRLVSARDAAITLLALTTGLRAGDIADIRVGDVCWRSMTVSIIQHKTSNPVKLPLRPAVADAIAEYVLEERPDTGDDHLFLRTRAPYAPLTCSASIYGATKNAMAAAGVEGAGTRLLRRNAATKMLRAGTASPVISAVLGHADPKSTDVYMERDGAPMRACVLPLPEGVRSWL